MKAFSPLLWGFLGLLVWSAAGEAVEGLIADQKLFYVGENITLHCISPKHFSSNMFFAAGNSYVPPEYVTLVNATYVRMDRPVTASDNPLIPFECVDNDTLVGSTCTIYTEFRPQKPTNLTAMWFDRNTAMFSWDLNETYKFGPNTPYFGEPVTLVTATFFGSNETKNCPVDSTQTSCEVEHLRDETVSLRVTVNNTRRGDTASETFNITKLSDHGKPKPAEYVTVDPKNSTCVTLKWKVDRVCLGAIVTYCRGQNGHPDPQNITMEDCPIRLPSDPRDVCWPQTSTEGPDSERDCLQVPPAWDNIFIHDVCHLHPSYNYTFQVLIKGRKGYPSDPRQTTTQMPEDAPASSPKAIGFSRADCVEFNTTGHKKVLVYFQPVPAEDENGKITYHAIFPEEARATPLAKTPSEGFYFEHKADCEAGLNVTLYASTKAGNSTPFYLNIPPRRDEASVASELKGMDLIVEKATDAVTATWTPPDPTFEHTLRLYYCLDTDRDTDICKDMRFAEVNASEGVYSMPVDRNIQKFGLGAVRYSDHEQWQGYGIVFTECVYSPTDTSETKSDLPEPVARSDYIQLFWRITRCDGNRVVWNYVISYCPVSSKGDTQCQGTERNITVDGKDSTYRLENLAQGQLYRVALWANTSSQSNNKFGGAKFVQLLPENNDGLPTKTVAMIVVLSLLAAGFAIFSLVLCCRRYRIRMKRTMDLMKQAETVQPRSNYSNGSYVHRNEDHNHYSLTSPAPDLPARNRTVEPLPLFRATAVVAKNPLYPRGSPVVPAGSPGVGARGGIDNVSFIGGESVVFNRDTRRGDRDTQPSNSLISDRNSHACNSLDSDRHDSRVNGAVCNNSGYVADPSAANRQSPQMNTVTPDSVSQQVNHSASEGECPNIGPYINPPQATSSTPCLEARSAACSQGVNLSSPSSLSTESGGELDRTAFVKDQNSSYYRQQFPAHARGPHAQTQNHLPPTTQTQPRSQLTSHLGPENEVKTFTDDLDPKTLVKTSTGDLDPESEVKTDFGALQVRRNGVLNEPYVLSTFKTSPNTSGCSHSSSETNGTDEPGTQAPIDLKVPVVTSSAVSSSVLSFVTSSTTATQLQSTMSSARPTEDFDFSTDSDVSSTKLHKSTIVKSTHMTSLGTVRVNDTHLSKRSQSVADDQDIFTSGDSGESDQRMFSPHPTNSTPKEKENLVSEEQEEVDHTSADSQNSEENAQETLTPAHSGKESGENAQAFLTSEDSDDNDKAVLTSPGFEELVTNGNQGKEAIVDGKTVENKVISASDKLHLDDELAVDMKTQIKNALSSSRGMNKYLPNGCLWEAVVMPAKDCSKPRGTETATVVEELPKASKLNKGYVSVCHCDGSPPRTESFALKPAWSTREKDDCKNDDQSNDDEADGDDRGSNEGETDGCPGTDSVLSTESGMDGQVRKLFSPTASSTQLSGGRSAPSTQLDGGRSGAEVFEDKTRCCKENFGPNADGATRLVSGYVDSVCLSGTETSSKPTERSTSSPSPAGDDVSVTSCEHENHDKARGFMNSPEIRVSPLFIAIQAMAGESESMTSHDVSQQDASPSQVNSKGPPNPSAYGTRRTSCNPPHTLMSQNDVDRSGVEPESPTHQMTSLGDVDDEKPWMDYRRSDSGYQSIRSRQSSLASQNETDHQVQLNLCKTTTWTGTG